MNTKPCVKCGSEVCSVNGFYDNDKTCKECRKSLVRKNRESKLEQYRAYDRKRANRPDRLKAREEYAKTPEGKIAAIRAKLNWALKNLEKKQASNKVNNAIKKGDLTKPLACSDCGISGVRIHGHHDDYSKPLEVRWLCSPCHHEWHKENGPGIFSEQRDN